ncbi:MAG: hypothetical protein KTV68_09225 [Acidimicrobiia bacterium]|nr:hypothetical protein [Acidimicrobiia bacterium]MCY4434841.1 alpha/beta hydrolase domain-containing protein [bacterium]
MTTPTSVAIEELPGTPPALIPRNYGLDELGYLEAEFEARGQAQSYRAIGELPRSGQITAEPNESAPFITRLLVRRPAAAVDFSGTVVVEWLNVSAGIDGSPDWDYMHRHIIRRGDAWVGVSAQRAGIDGGGLAEGLHLKLYKPQRYGHLSHPGDAFSYDIFTQVAKALRQGGSPLIGDLNPQRLLAVGESQSAAFLATYVNAIDPLVQTFDGYFLHGRPGVRTELNGTFGPRVLNERYDAMAHCPEQIRADARVPVLLLSSETDVTVLRNEAIEQPDSENIRVWELPGAAHADTYLLVASRADGGQLEPSELARMLEPITDLVIMTVDRPINSAPHQHYVAQAALEHLDRWAGGGEPPPIAPRLQLGDDGITCERDDLGNARGGIRNPWVDTPLRMLSGEGQEGDGFAFLFGTTAPLETGTIDRLYPGGGDDYLAAFTESLDQTIAGGYILAIDRSEILAIAAETFELARLGVA